MSLYKPALAISAILFICSNVVLGQGEPSRPTYLGISPAYPIKDTSIIYDFPAPYSTGQKSYALKLQIDQDGKVSDCKPFAAQDSTVAKHVLSGVINLLFNPAIVDGNPVKSELIIEATINPLFRQTTLAFPIDSKLKVIDRRLYFSSLETFEVSLPKIVEFPSYFCDLDARDTLALLPYLLLKLNLDSSGQMTESKILGNSIGSFSSQIQSALLWAKFEPLKLAHSPRASECFLLITFHPQINYPTMKVEKIPGVSSTWYDKQRVELLADTVGLMTPIVPRRLNYEQEKLSGTNNYLGGEITAFLAFDSTGRAFLRQTDSKNAAYHKVLSASCKNWGYYPAMEFSGKPVKFEGTAQFEFQNSMKVRIHYNWLN